MYKRNFRRLNSSVRNRYNNRRKLNCAVYGMSNEEFEQQLEDNIYEAFQEITGTNINIFETFSDVYVQTDMTVRGTEYPDVKLDVELTIDVGSGLPPVRCYAGLYEDDAPLDIYNQCRTMAETALGAIKYDIADVFCTYLEDHSKDLEINECDVIPGERYNLWEIDVAIDAPGSHSGVYTVRISPDRKSIEDAAQAILNRGNR